MSKIPYTGKSQQARQGQSTQNVSADPLAPAENIPPKTLCSKTRCPGSPAGRVGRLRAQQPQPAAGLAGGGGAGGGGRLRLLYLAQPTRFKSPGQHVPRRDNWEADSLSKAVKGDGKAPGLTTVVSEYGNTKAGNLANFYAGVAALKQGRYKEALDDLEDFSSDDYLVQSRAYSLMGDAQLELNQPKAAADLYAKAADHNANEYFSPGYLLKEGVARELAKDNEGALKAYNRIIADYPTAQEVAEARQYKAKLEK